MLAWVFSAAALGAPCATGTVTYDTGVLHMELRWEKPGELLALRCRDPKHPELLPPELKLEASVKEGWAAGDTLENTSDQEKRAQYTGEIDQYLADQKVPTDKRFAIANLLSFDCISTWQQWAEVVGPSCGGAKTGLESAEVGGKTVLTRTEDFESSLIGRGSTSKDDLITRWTRSEDGWVERIEVIHKRGEQVVEEKSLARHVPGAASPETSTAEAKTPTE